MIINAQTKLNIEQDFKIQAGPGAGKQNFGESYQNVIQTSEKLERMKKIACTLYEYGCSDSFTKIRKSVSNRVDISTIHSFLYRNVVKPYCSFHQRIRNLCAKIKRT